MKRETIKTKSTYAEPSLIEVSHAEWIQHIRKEADKVSHYTVTLFDDHKKLLHGRY